MTDRTCILSHYERPDEPRATWGEALICRGHVYAVRRALGDLAAFPAQADQASYAETVSVSLSPPMSGSKSEPLPINERRTEHVIQARGILASWCQLIAEERQVQAPGSPDVRLTTSFLLVHHEWSVCQPWADEMAGEVLALARRAWSLVNPSGARRVPCGPCREVLDDGTTCDGMMSAIVRKADDYEKSQLVCDSCTTEIPADRWLTFGRQVIKAREEAA